MDVRLDRRNPHRQGPAPLANRGGPVPHPTLNERWRGPTRIRRQHRRRPAHAGHRPNGGARLRRCGGQRRGGDRLRREGGRVTGAEVDTGGGTVGVRARAVVNAMGLWADDLGPWTRAPTPHHPARQGHPHRGPVGVSQRDRCRGPGAKRQALGFVVPWAGAGGEPGGEGSVTYIGTTRPTMAAMSTIPVHGRGRGLPARRPQRSLSEPIGPEDVLGTWAGLRPLVADATSGRRPTCPPRPGHDLGGRHGDVTCGKLTTYREMARDAVDAAVGVLAARVEHAAQRHPQAGPCAGRGLE